MNLRMNTVHTDVHTLSRTHINRTTFLEVGLKYILKQFSNKKIRLRPVFFK